MLQIVCIIFSILGMAYGAVKGYRRGFTGLAPSVLAFACGAVVAHICSEAAAPTVFGWLPVRYDSIEAAFVASFLPGAVLYVLTYCIVEFVTDILRRILGVFGFGILNALSGALFGAFNCMVWVSLLLNFWVCINPSTSLLDSLTHDDGNLIGQILLIAPAVVGSESPADFSHELQVRDAKKISCSVVKFIPELKYIPEILNCGSFSAVTSADEYPPFTIWKC